MEPGPNADVLSHLRTSIKSRCRHSAKLIDSARLRAHEQRITARAIYDRAEHQFARSIQQATRNNILFSGDERSRADVLQDVLEEAISIYPGCLSASITSVYDDDAGGDLRYATVAFSGTESTADAAQYALDEGPCLEAIELDRVTVVGTDDLTNAYPTAWPRFTGVARDLGIRSAISIGLPWSRYWTGPVTPNEPPIGAINLYAVTPYQFFAKEFRAITLGVHAGARLTGAAPAEVYDASVSVSRT